MSASIPAQVPVFTVLLDGPSGDNINAIDQNSPNDEITALATLVGMFGSGKTQAYGTDLLAFLCNANPICTKLSNNTINVSPGSVFIKNSGQSFRLPRLNTTDTVVSASNIDTGSLVIGFYYIYACADTVANTFTVVFSASSSAPTGYTNYEKIGWFYNESNGSLNVTLGFVGNNKKNKRDVPNHVSTSGTTNINTTSTSYVDMTDMLIYFVSTGRPIVVAYGATHEHSANTGQTYLSIDIDGSDVFKGLSDAPDANNNAQVQLLYSGIIAEGSHTIKVKWKTPTGTSTQNGSAEAPRYLQVFEL